MNDRFKIVNNIKDLNEFISTLLINYPKVEFNLKNRLENTLYDLLEQVYLANSFNDKIDLQRIILSKVSMIDYYIELSYKRKCISLKKLNIVSSKLDVIRKMLYGWIKSGSKVQ